jgi:hypothetical protein
MEYFCDNYISKKTNRCGTSILLFQFGVVGKAVVSTIFEQKWKFEKGRKVIQSSN